MTEIEKRAEAQNKQRKNEAGRWRKWVRIYVIVEAIVFVFALRSVFVPILLMLLLITGVLLITGSRGEGRETAGTDIREGIFLFKDAKKDR